MADQMTVTVHLLIQVLTPTPDGIEWCTMPRLYPDTAESLANLRQMAGTDGSMRVIRQTTEVVEVTGEGMEGVGRG